MGEYIHCLRNLNIVSLLPSFERVFVEAWFLQVESIFGLCEITNSVAKYRYVMIKLPLEVVQTFLSSQNTTNENYETLKNFVVKNSAENLNARSSINSNPVPSTSGNLNAQSSTQSSTGNSNDRKIGTINFGFKFKLKAISIS